MRESNNVIREEFLLLTKRLKLDTGSIPLDIIGTPECTPSFLDNHFAMLTKDKCSNLFVGPYLKGGMDKLVCPCSRLSDSALDLLTAVYKKLFLPNRQIRFIGVDLDDCLYDVTPIRHRLVQKIHTALKPSPLSLRAEGKAISWALYSAYKDDLEAEAIKKQKAKASLESRVMSLGSGLRTPDPRLIDSYIERTYHAYKDFSRLDNPDIRALYKPYKGVKGTLRDLVGSGFIVGILTNGPSRFQKDKIGLLGLKEGKHFNFVTVSEETGIGKPSRRFFKLARERASQFVVRRSPLVARKAGDESRVTSDECLILEDQVKNISGADGWLKVQFLRGYHSNIQPENVHEIPKYGITSFSLIPDLIKLEKDSDFQAVSGSYFILKSLLLIAYNLCYESPLLSI